MVPIMARQSPQAVARQWLRDHPEDLQRWLAGVAAFDGGDGVIVNLDILFNPHFHHGSLLFLVHGEPFHPSDLNAR